MPAHFCHKRNKGDCYIMQNSKKKWKRITGKFMIFMISCIFVQTSVFAEVLGTATEQWSTDMGGGAVYNHTVFYSDSVGNQTENYVVYTPNSEVVPIVVNGESVYGTRTISSAAEYMEQNNLRPLIGINGDYFSTKTGIPMGYTIIDGEIYSKESGTQDAIGFRSDGTAFIDKLGIDASVENESGVKIPIQYINKWPQDGFSWVYMLTDDYGDTTKTNFNALYVICSAISGDLSINSEMTLGVDEVFIYDGEIAIPEGKYVLIMDPDGEPECFNMLASLAPGNTLTFRNSTYGTTHDWAEAEYGLSTIGGRLIENGAIGSGFEAGASPRTAVGVREDGSVVFYTLDGRQSGYSYGARIETIANRMKELGCVDAINLDGGGSTAIGAVFPGSNSFVVTNQPSDGVQRRCANYIFLRDMRPQTGIPWYVEWREYENRNYLAGTSLQLEATSVYDTGNYKMDSLTGVTYSADNEGGAATEVDENGYISFKGTGTTYINVTGERYSKTFDFAVYETPDEIRVYNEATGEEINEITVDEGGMYNIDLEASAYVNGIRLESYPSLFRWETDGSGIAEVDEDGVVSVHDNGSGGGVLSVTVGGCTKAIPITVTEKESFADMQGHWAHDIVESMADLGIINGFEENGVSLFKPDENITRIQFAAIMCKALGVNISDFSNTSLNFADVDEIQPWAVDYVKAMSALGYITGRSDNGNIYYFAPEDSITRAEAFTIMGRAIESSENTVLNYADAGDIPEWAQQPMGELAALGLIKGYSDNTIRPGDAIKRAEAASLINNFLSLEEEAEEKI